MRWLLLFVLGAATALALQGVGSSKQNAAPAAPKRTSSSSSHSSAAASAASLRPASPAPPASPAAKKSPQEAGQSWLKQLLSDYALDKLVLLEDPIDVVHPVMDLKALVKNPGSYDIAAGKRHSAAEAKALAAAAVAHAPKASFTAEVEARANDVFVSAATKTSLKLDDASVKRKLYAFAVAAASRESTTQAGTVTGEAFHHYGQKFDQHAMTSRKGKA